MTTRDWHPCTEEEILQLESKGLLTKAQANKILLNHDDLVFIMIKVDGSGNVYADLVGTEKLAIKKYGRERVVRK